MPNVDKGVLTWGGSPVVGGGVSIFYASPFSGALSALGTFFNAIKGVLPSAVGITFPSTGDTIDAATGGLVGAWSATAPSPVVGTGSTDFSAASGAVIQWNTSTIHPGKPPVNLPYKVVGHTFIVPLDGGAYSFQGVIDASAVSLLQAAADSLIANTGGGMRVYSRPTPGASNGLAAPVISARVRSKVAILRSRRD